MDLLEVGRELKRLGTAQNRKVYGRHGVREPMYGASFADLRALKKKIKIDQPLAEKLWASGNHDSRVLATMIADPDAIRAIELEGWLGELDNYVIADAFSGLVWRTPYARSKAEKWLKSRKEFIGQVGYNLLAHLAMNDEELSDRYFEDQLKRIEAGIHGSANRIRHAMNQALIAIGVRNRVLERRAVAVARRIGKVEVDHGDTSCKTPDAVAYIKKVIEHRG
ncbi:MAG: DNA alkylation repair protein [Acidobacteria bacterium]|nr:DNA alkylation repair protein [Acidobacteriota bacterium]